MDYKTQIENNINKLKSDRAKATTIEQMKDIDWKINMCLLKLGITDYDTKTNEFKRI